MIKLGARASVRSDGAHLGICMGRSDKWQALTLSVSHSTVTE